MGNLETFTTFAAIGAMALIALAGFLSRGGLNLFVWVRIALAVVLAIAFVIGLLTIFKQESEAAQSLGGMRSSDDQWHAYQGSTLAKRQRTARIVANTKKNTDTMNGTVMAAHTRDLSSGSASGRDARID